jgi:hypothetical protein
MRHLLTHLRWAGALVGVIGAVSVGHTADRSPEDTLKQSLAFLSAQNRLSVRFSSDIEVVTPALEKVQFSGSGTVGMERPDRFRISRVGGFADVELISDGTSFTIHDRGGKRFAQIPVTGPLDQVIARLRSEFHFDLPGSIALPTPWFRSSLGRVAAAASDRADADEVIRPPRWRVVSRCIDNPTGLFES